VLPSKRPPHNISFWLQ